MTLTIEHTTTTAPAITAPLTDAEADTLLVSAAGLEKASKVKGGSRIQSQSRAWSRGGSVD